jgi:multidrug resistance efflux pump
VFGPFALACLLSFAAGCGPGTSSTPPPAASAPAPSGGLRLTGTVEAVRSRTIGVPRLAGTFTPMIITTLAKPGTRVKTGDLLVAFDRQAQQLLASDKRAEVVDLDGQIEKKRAEQAAAEVKEKTGLVAAENDVARSKLDVSTNELIAGVAAEKNTLTLEQNIAKLEQLRATYDLRREAAAADLQILMIRRARAEKALTYAEDNATKMEIFAPFSGLVVVRTMYRPGGSGYVEILEGDEVRPGLPVVDIVDTSAMQVRARLNQADAELVRAGQPATVRLDGFPELTFKGRIDQVMPLARSSEMSMGVRTFVAVVSIEGTHAQLLPDLTASVEVTPVAPAAPAPKGVK